MDIDQILQEQAECVRLREQGMTQVQIGAALHLSRDQVRRRLGSAEVRAKLDPEIADRLKGRGIVDLGGLHSGWLIEKDQSGAGQSLYFYVGQDQERINFADAMKEVLSEIPRLPKIKAPKKKSKDTNKYANWIALADLHIGGDYGDPAREQDVNAAVDDLVSRLPAAKHAVLFELGDLLEANDHKGITPTSGNLLDVKREDHLPNTLAAVRIVRRILYRLLETHETVEAHFIKGNHDTTAHIAVMIALQAHFEDNPRIHIVTSNAEFRVVTWGSCAAFPHHGDTLKWEALKDVFADQFPDAWAKAKAHRIIMTAHFHTDRKRDLVGCVAEHYRTLHRPNAWAKSKGFYNRGSLTAMTVHQDRGEEYRTISNIRHIPEESEA